MQYRKLGKTDLEVSALGFGAMRLPLVDKDPAKIDETKAKKMLHHAIERGVNYIDTAYIYHGGTSEVFLGKFLKQGYRSRVKLATKLPPWDIQSSEQFDTILNHQLKKLQTDFIDCYLLHGLNAVHWTKLKELGVLDWAEKAIAEGKIGYLGFSFHDSIEMFKEIINSYDNWGFCQIQLNYMDIEFQAGLEGLAYAADKGLGVIAMEPLRGGQLVLNPPDIISELWTKSPTQRSIAEHALQWVWNFSEVAVVLSGMSSIRDLKENLDSADRSKPNSLSKTELKIFDKVRAEFLKVTPIGCTACKYCMPCPEDIEIFTIFEKYNAVKRYGGLQDAKRFYNGFLANHQADRCIECFSCEEKCPQKVEIVSWLGKCHQEFT